MMTDEKANIEEEANMDEQTTPTVENTAENVSSTSANAEEAESDLAEVASTESESEISAEETPSSEKTEDEPVVTQSEASTEEVVPVVPKKEYKPDDGKRWFSLRVISGKERKIKERIELEVQRSGWTDYITQILVPTEKVYKIRQGKKVISERNILPGYILVEAVAKNFSGEMVQAITGMPNVIHFLGRNNPIPMQQSEANRMLGKVDESQDVGESLLEPFIVGETVKIIDGPFNEFVGDIQEINDEKKKLKVIVKIFGRGTEVELNFVQVDKQA
jgi:transcriptional antiterminator NusG